MSYTVCEAALATQLASTTGFSAAQVSLGDWSILARGLNPVAILGYDGFTNEDSTFDAEVQTTWRIAVNLLILYRTDTQLHADSVTYRQAIFDRLSAYRQLGAGDASGLLVANLTDGEPLTKRGTGGAIEAIVAGNVRYAHEVLHVGIEDEQDYALSG